MFTSMNSLEKRRHMCKMRFFLEKWAENSPKFGGNGEGVEVKEDDLDEEMESDLALLGEPDEEW